jgi:SAM-dependent methyltransferase
VRAIFLLLVGAGVDAEPMRWADLPSATRFLVAQSGLTEAAFPDWQARHKKASAARLAEGTAEHIAYFLLQSRSFTADPRLDPAAEARHFLDSLPLSARQPFLADAYPPAPIGKSVRRRMDAFWNTQPVAERHRLLREMAGRLGWPPDRIVLTAFRFLMQRSQNENPDALYQARGLSADPFPPSMRAVERGLDWLRAHRREPIEGALVVGPGADLGSRFGVDDLRSLVPSQPAALLTLLAQRPAKFDCVDIRPEVVTILAAGPCRASMLDVAAERILGGPYDLAVATNVLVYLDDTELAVTLANLSHALRPGGCLLHNDSRFAARLFGEAAGMPVSHFESVPLERLAGREQLDRIVIHCRPRTKP